MQKEEIEHIRVPLDAVVDQAINTLREIESDYPESTTEAHLQYLITSILTEVYAESGYKAINDAVGVLECAKYVFLTLAYMPGEEE